MAAVEGINGDRHCQKAADEMRLVRRQELDIISAHVRKSVMRGEKVIQGDSVEEEGREPGMASAEKHQGMG